MELRLTDMWETVFTHWTISFAWCGSSFSVHIGHFSIFLGETCIQIFIILLIKIFFFCLLISAVFFTYFILLACVSVCAWMYIDICIGIYVLGACTSMWDSPVNIGAGHVWIPEFNLWNSHGGKTKATSLSYPLTSTFAYAGKCMHARTNTPQHSK